MWQNETVILGCLYKYWLFTMSYVIIQVYWLKCSHIVICLKIWIRDNVFTNEHYFPKDTEVRRLRPKVRETNLCFQLAEFWEYLWLLIYLCLVFDISDSKHMFVCFSHKPAASHLDPVGRGLCLTELLFHDKR